MTSDTFSITCPRHYGAAGHSAGRDAREGRWSCFGAEAGYLSKAPALSAPFL